jgi:hypothetical protein
MRLGAAHPHMVRQPWRPPVTFHGVDRTLEKWTSLEAEPAIGMDT